MRVDEFVARALYDPTSGFYETGGRAGRRDSSFITSPEVGPLFGAAIARALDRWWTEAGEPDEWVVVDAGAGPGTLARTIVAAEPTCGPALRLVSVERSNAQRAMHPPAALPPGDSSTDGGPRIESAGELPTQADVIVANELLDNLPFGLLERTADGWVEVTVDPEGDTHPATGGPRVPVVASAAAWVAHARSTLRAHGRLLCFDYGDTTAALAGRPWTDWVRAFADQEELPDPFVEPGSRDVTVVVAVDQLPPPHRTFTQAAWLRAHGIDDLVAEGRAHWERSAAAPDLTAIRMRSRAVEVEALLDPDGLGGFWVGEWRR